MNVFGIVPPRIFWASTIKGGHNEATYSNHTYIFIKVMKIPHNFAICSVQLSHAAHSLTKSNEKKIGNISRQAPPPDLSAE